MDYGLCFFHSYLQSFWISLFIVTFVFMIIKTLTLKPESSKFPPGPKPWPVVGNLPEMLANQPVFRWIHEILEEMNTEIACIRLGNVHVIPVSCPTLACEFLKTHDAAFASRPLTMATDIISDGYLTTTVAPFGEQQKKMKKMVVDHLLSPFRDQCLLDKRNEEADNLMFYVYNNVKDNGGLVNVRIAARHYCGNLVRKLTFNTRYFGKGGKDAGGPGFEEVEHVDAAFTLLRYAFAFCVSDYIPCLRRLDLDGHKSKVKNAMRIVEKYHDPIIEDRIKRWSNGSKTTVEDWLDALISAKDVNNNPLLTMKEIKAQTTELLLAMLDNPSNGFEWALAEMINQPKLLQQATEELDNVVGKNRLVQESDIPKLNFVKACAREALRLHPVSPFTVPHVSMSDTIVGNYLIPKGSHVLLSRIGLGRNSKVWTEPLKFKPERHLSNIIDGSSSYNNIALTEPDLRFISFSTGRRGCPGATLGTTMIIMLFARLLHGFTWSAAPNVSSINLAESKGDLFLAEPLVVVAKPRLAAELYNIKE